MWPTVPTCVSLTPNMDPPRNRAWGAAYRAPEDSARIAQSVDYCWRFFVGESDAQRAVGKIVEILEREGIPHAVSAHSH